MKKIFFIVNLIFLIFIFSSCSNNITETTFYDDLENNISYNEYSKVPKRTVFINSDGKEEKYSNYGIIGLLIYSNECSICKNKEIENAVLKASQTTGFYCLNAKDNFEIIGDLEDEYSLSILGFYFFEDFKTRTVPVFIIIYFDKINTGYEEKGYYYEFTKGEKVAKKILDYAEYLFY